MKIKSGAGTNMIRYACGMTAAIVLLSMDVSSGWSQQQYLYSPTAVDKEVKVSSKDGVLVQEVSVRKGDTLSGISRKFSGRGSYYPQILLFNDIKNPDKIYPGNVFKVPVSRNVVSSHVDAVPVKKITGPEPGRAATNPKNADSSAVLKTAPVVVAAEPVTDLATHDLKKVDAGRKNKKGTREKTTGSEKKQVNIEKQRAGVVPDSAAGQLLFERAVKAYRQEDYRAALDFFDKFLVENQTSPLAADASLYKAECYLKLSAQK